MTATASISKKAFTLVELMVTVAVVALLAALLLPAMAASLERAREAHCLNNLRQMGIAARVYANSHNDYLPPAYAPNHFVDGNLVRTEWDYATTIDWNQGGARRKQPGLLWGGDVDARVQQCPSFHGSDNAMDDPYTGYNYNTSYLGHGPSEANPEPASFMSVHYPELCAMFGEGEYGEGANKYMRAPFDDVEGGGDRFAFRYAGTQGFRHRDQTLVAFVDGHTEARSERFTENAAGPDRIANGTGFLSPNNDLYDLD